MFSTSRSLLLAATFIATPMAFASAQQNNPTGNMGSNRSVTASPGTADSKAASGLNSGDVNAHRTTGGNYAGSATNSTKPGATGRTVVPGTSSSQANSASGTAGQKTGTTTSGGGAN